MYRLAFARAARKELEALAARVSDRIMEAIERLTENPRPRGSTKMKGTLNKYRIRVGDYRVIYEILDKELVVLIIRVRHRKDAYDN